MTHDEADAKARELNEELGARWDDLSFYIAIEVAPGGAAGAETHREEKLAQADP